MTFNLTILETVTETAKAKAANQPAWVRAIEKAAEQLITNPYICETDDGLLILSYSGETYRANGACQCRAYANNKPCWHRSAAQLVKRYNEAAQAAPVAPVMIERIHHKDGTVEVIEHGQELIDKANELLDRAIAREDSAAVLRRQWEQSAPAPAAETVATDDRAQLVADVKAAWHRARPFASYAVALHQHFGVTRLEDVPADGLRLIHSLLLQPVRHSPAPAAARPIITSRKALDACTKRRRTVGLDGWYFKRPAGHAAEGWNA